MSNTSNVVPIDDIMEDLSNEKELLFTDESFIDVINRAKDLPDPEPLYRNFIIEGEHTILFSDTSKGKSLFMVGLGNQWAHQGHKVRYFNFELSDKQLKKRHGNMKLSKNFRHSSMKRFVEMSDNPDIADKQIKDSIEEVIKRFDEDIFIIDNLTWLSVEASKTRYAAILARFLMGLIGKYNKTIISIAHTVKRDESRPIAVNDLGGSKIIINFADACIAIGENHLIKGGRYLKQVKVRSGEMIYDSDNVLLLDIDAKPGDVTMKERADWDTADEETLLMKKGKREVTADERVNRSAQIAQLKVDNPGISNIQLRKELKMKKNDMLQHMKDYKDTIEYLMETINREREVDNVFG